MTKKADKELVTFLFIAAGTILLLPFLIFSLLHYQKLKKKYLSTNSARRVMDIQRIITPFIASASITIVILYLLFASQSTSSQLIGISFSAIIIITWAFFAYLFSRHMSVLYLGFICNKKTDKCTFPHDMQSYDISDFIELKFIHDYTNPDTINLSEIRKTSRARGTELYIHGDFGSRRLIFSSKQKRDEAISLIQMEVNKDTSLMFETEQYGS